jgi:hypothetical protein
MSRTYDALLKAEMGSSAPRRAPSIPPSGDAQETNPPSSALAQQPVLEPSGRIAVLWSRLWSRLWCRIAELLEIHDPHSLSRADLVERVATLEARLGGLEEGVAKKIDENEGRTLHLVERRLRSHESQLSGTLRLTIAAEVQRRTRSLRARSNLLLAMAVLALAASAAALLANLGMITL